MAEEGERRRLIVGINDVDAQVKQEQEYERRLALAQKKALIDALTGVKNKYAYLDAEERLNTEIAEDQSELPRVYDPTHPDADEEGYVELPNVTLVAEVTDAMAASQAFNANVTAFNALEQVMQSGLNIGV